jgi:hypothetical protein
MIFMMVFAGCAAKHVGIDDQHAVTGHREVLVQQVEYCPKGLPSFLNQLGSRPSETGDHFTVAQLVNDRPASSFDITVVGPDTDFKKPFKVVYEWTGKGFRGGALGSAATLEVASGVTPQHNDEALLLVAVVLAPVVVGTVGGFIIGVADGIKTTAEEVGKVMLGNYEQVVTYTTYAYDVRDRLLLMRMFKADENQQELVRTEYLYEADSAKPVKTVITTFPGGAVKTL